MVDCDGRMLYAMEVRAHARVIFLLQEIVTRRERERVACVQTMLAVRTGPTKARLI